MPSQFNELLNSQQYIPQNIPLPFDQMMAVGQMKQQQQDKAEAERQSLLGKQWNSLSQDIPETQKLHQQINSTLEDFSNKDFTDPQVKAQWYNAKRELADNFGPQGKVGAIEGSYNARQADIAELQKLKDKGPKEGGIDVDTYNKLAQESMNKYTGIGERGTQGYNTYRGTPAAGFSDYVSEADNLAKGWKENAVSSGAYKVTPDGKFQKKTTNGWEGVDKNEIYSNILPELMQNKNHIAYLNQQARLDLGPNATPEAIQHYTLQHLHTAANAAANKYSFNKRTYDESLTTDPGYDKDEHTNSSSFIHPGVQYQQVSDIKNIGDLTSKIDTDKAAIAAKQKDLDTKKATGEYSDPNFIKGKQDEIAIATEANRRLELTKQNAIDKEKKVLSPTEKKDLESYDRFKLETKDLTGQELQEALAQDPSAVRGAKIAADVTDRIDKNIDLVKESAVSPNVVLPNDPKKIKMLDEDVNRNYKSTNLRDPNTGNVVTQKELEAYDGAKFAGYSEDPQAVGSGDKFQIKLQPKDKDGKERVVYMDAPLNFGSYKQGENPDNTALVQSVAQKVQDIKNDPRMPPSGKIILHDNKNYGEIIVPNRLPKTDVHYSDNPNEIVWKDPTGKMQNMTPSQLGLLIAKYPNLFK